MLQLYPDIKITVIIVLSTLLECFIVKVMQINKAHCCCSVVVNELWAKCVHNGNVKNTSLRFQIYCIAIRSILRLFYRDHIKEIGRIPTNLESNKLIGVKLLT